MEICTEYLFLFNEQDLPALLNILRTSNMRQSQPPSGLWGLWCTERCAAVTPWERKMAAWVLTPESPQVREQLLITVLNTFSISIEYQR